MPPICETFEASGQVIVSSPLTGSITLSPTNAPNCGVTINGNLGLIPDFCKTIGASFELTGTGQASTTSYATVTGGPNCNIDLSASVDVPCLTGGGSVTVNSPLSGSISLEVGCNDVRINGNIGIELNQTIQITLRFCCKRVRICANGNVEEVVMVVCCSSPNNFPCSPFTAQVQSQSQQPIVQIQFPNANGC
jgi:hypothetical protein